jgi:hypothetical protein
LKLSDHLSIFEEKEGSTVTKKKYAQEQEHHTISAEPTPSPEYSARAKVSKENIH